MATVTGSWAGSGRARGRLIIEYSTSNVSDSVTRVSGSVKVEADYSVSDSNNTFTRSGSGANAGSGSVALSVSSGGKQTIHTWSKDLARGASAGSRAAAFSLAGVDYWGATATVSTDIPVPAVPAADTPTSVSITRQSLTSVKVAWGGGAAHEIQVRKRGGDGDGTADWGDWSTVSDAGTAVSSGIVISVPGSRDYQARVRRQNAAGAYSGWGTSSNTARLYDAPSQPATASATRTSDALFPVAWTGSSTQPIRWVDVQRWTKSGAAWVDAATSLTGSARSWSDTRSMPDDQIKWRVRYRNSAGSSDWRETTDLATTPAASSRPAGARSGSTDIVTSWTNAARAAVGIDLRAASSSDGGTTWSAFADVSGHTGLAPATTTRTVTGLDPAKLWRFETRTYVTTPALSAYSGGGTVVQLLSPPSAPVLVAPLGTLSSQAVVAFSWRHQPVDSSDQTAAEVRYRINGAAWVTLTATSASSVSTAAPVAAGTLEWQARTRGAHADWSPWSGTASLLVASPPAIAITSPAAGAVIGSNRLTLTLAWSDAQGAAMTRRTRRLRDASGEVIEEVTTSGATSAITFSTLLVDGAAYTAEVEATAGTGLTSGTASVSVSVDFIDPGRPILTAAWVEDRGLTDLAVTNAEATPATEVRRNQVLRPRMLRGTDLPLNLPANATISPTSNTDGELAITLTAVAAGTNNGASPPAAGPFEIGAYYSGAIVVRGEGSSATGRTVYAILHDGKVPVARSANIFLTDQPVRIEIPSTIATTAAAARIYLYFGNPSPPPTAPTTTGGWAVGDVFYISRPQVERVSAPGETIGAYFDGGFSPEAELIPSWVGAADNSASILTRPATDATAANRVERSTDGGVTWVAVADQLGVDAGLVDNRVPLNTTARYRAVAISALGAEAVGEMVEVVTTSTWVWLTTADSAQAIEANITIDSAPGQEVVMERYYGDVRPTPHFGEGRPESVQVGGLLRDHRDRWNPRALHGREVFYRDPDGRAFWGAVTAGPTLQSTRQGAATVALTIEAVEEAGDA